MTDFISALLAVLFTVFLFFLSIHFLNFIAFCARFGLEICFSNYIDYIKDYWEERKQEREFKKGLHLVKGDFVSAMTYEPKKVKVKIREEL